MQNEKSEMLSTDVRFQFSRLKVVMTRGSWQRSRGP